MLVLCTVLGAFSQQPVADQLIRLDSAIFSAAFQLCEFSVLEKILAPDFEFYQQTSEGNIISVTKRVQFLKNIRDNFCTENARKKFSLKRELIKETVTASPMGNYGAIQSGLQRFYSVENGKEELVEISRFTRIWKKLGDSWQLARESDEKLNPNSRDQFAGPQSYTPSDPALYKTISRLDSLLFDAYNNCKLDISTAMYSDSIEFYHDRGGLSTSKKDLIQALKNNICDKVTRHLKPNSIEVSPIPGYGAVEIGEHRFHNKQEPNAPSHYSRFVIVWQFKNEQWVVAKVISLH